MGIDVIRLTRQASMAPTKHGKKISHAANAGGRETRKYLHAPAKRRYAESAAALQKLKFAKFDETVGLSMRLGVDPKHADQMVRGTVVLPHGLGKTKRVLVIAGADKQKEAEEAGADVRRRRRAGREDPGRLDRLRRRRRHARHDAGRSASSARCSGPAA